MLELTVGFMVYQIIEVYLKTLKFLLPLKLEVYPASKIIRYVCVFAESWIVYIQRKDEYYDPSGQKEGKVANPFKK